MPRRRRYCPSLCPEKLGSGGVLRNTISKNSSFNEVNDQLVLVPTSTAFLCGLRAFEHHGETGFSGATSLGFATTTATSVFGSRYRPASDSSSALPVRTSTCSWLSLRAGKGNSTMCSVCCSSRTVSRRWARINHPSLSRSWSWMADITFGLAPRPMRAYLFTTSTT
jgi:hypothetical protein